MILPNYQTAPSPALPGNGDAKLARRGKTVLGLATALGLSADQVDQLVIAAEELEV